MQKSKDGFTLIELMIVVAILGILAALAIPQLSQYIRRSKAAEAYEDLKQMFNLAATYYTADRAEKGLGGDTLTACTVDSADNQVDPDSSKQRGDYSAASFHALGYSTVTSYYRYEIQNADGNARCSVSKSTAPIYVLRAVGDLDDDNVNSTFELATGSNADNELYHSRSFYVDNETE